MDVRSCDLMLVVWLFVFLCLFVFVFVIFFGVSLCLICSTMSKMCVWWGNELKGAFQLKNEKRVDEKGKNCVTKEVQGSYWTEQRR